MNALLVAGPSPAPMAMNSTGAPPPEPDTEQLAALEPPYIATADVEYTPLRAPPSGPAVMDVGMGMMVETATECAQVRTTGACRETLLVLVCDVWKFC